MRTIIILIFLTQSFFQVFGQNNLKKIIRENKISKISEIYYLNDSKKKDGEYKYSYKNNTQIAGHYKDDKKNGLWIYTPSKDFKISGEFEDNLQANKWIYTDNKDTLAILNYKNGRLNGIQYGYFKSGQIAAKIHYNDAGKLHGEEIRYYQNGNISESMNYLNGELHGDYLMYLENGELITKLTYSSSTPINLENYTNDPSLEMYYGDLKNGNGELSKFIKNQVTNKNQIFINRNYKDSLLHGGITGYNYNGNISFKGQYFKGFMDGKWKFYNENGEFEKEKDYSYSLRLTMDSLEDQTNYDFEVVLSNLEYMPPRFCGKEAIELRGFIAQNLRYPIGCFRNGIQGMVKVQFKINSIGEVVDVEVIESVHQLLDEEAIRLVSLSPMWVPEIQNGIPVSTQFTFPINFVLR